MDDYFLNNWTLKGLQKWLSEKIRQTTEFCLQELETIKPVGDIDPKWNQQIYQNVYKPDCIQVIEQKSWFYGLIQWIISDP